VPLTITNATISTNTARGGDGGWGGVANQAYTAGGGAGGVGQGGGLWVSGILAVVNSTISTNTIRGGDGGHGGAGHTGWGHGGNGGVGQGGAFWLGSGALELTNVTVAENKALDSIGGEGGLMGQGQLGQGGGVRNSGGTVDALNSLFADNTAAVHPDVSGNFADATYNLLGDGTGSNLINGVNGNLVGSADDPLDPLLGPLADNGGPTLTHALLDGSPALDAGTSDGAPPTDQRGVPRDNPPDIGAYEVPDVPRPIPSRGRTALPGRYLLVGPVSVQPSPMFQTSLATANATTSMVPEAVADSITPAGFVEVGAPATGTQRFPRGHGPSSFGQAPVNDLFVAGWWLQPICDIASLG
jgi:hypothetical protein